MSIETAGFDERDRTAVEIAANYGVCLAERENNPLDGSSEPTAVELSAATHTAELIFAAIRLNKITRRRYDGDKLTGTMFALVDESLNDEEDL